ncbi:MAG: 23S rRNA (uracil(1939)-C(5))-methyltransferase RlmD [Acidimicrobiia bacterium]|nr:23S rRNA (uracil(1939)-C(5))-methyltransferase RlmD [Acidimicrobiia bacterium]
MRLRLETMAHGGAAVARHDGKVVFVQGGVAGDEVEVGLIEEKKSFDVGLVTEVVEPSADRISPSCPWFATCGGCQWQYMTLEAQHRWKRETIIEQLRRIGRVADPVVHETVATGDGYGYRNRLDVGVVNGLPAFREAGSHRLVGVDACLLAAPSLARLLDSVQPIRNARQLVLRVGVRTGESLVVSKHRSGRLHEIVAGQRFRISGRAFFQVNTAGADALVNVVGEALAPSGDDVLLDGYAGGGLFSATVGRAAGAVVAVESDETALSDLAVNVSRARVVAVPFENSEPGRADLAVVDPPRTGLGPDAVSTLLRAGPRRIAYVSCDPASFSRDVRLLDDAGYRLVAVTPVDMFPQTFHIEVVGVLEKR